MSERPILFSGPMIRAILAGAKSQTRRLVTRATSTCGSAEWPSLRFAEAFPTTSGETLKAPGNRAVHSVRCRWCVGDDLWVRETWREEAGGYSYRATYDDPGNDLAWRPSIFMPRPASRLSLRVTSIRVERLHDITEEDARAEGAAVVYVGPHPQTRNAFAALWDKINGKRASWGSNPWVWVIAFERLTRVAA